MDKMEKLTKLTYDYASLVEQYVREQNEKTIATDGTFQMIITADFYANLLKRVEEIMEKKKVKKDDKEFIYVLMGALMDVGYNAGKISVYNQCDE